MRHVSHDLNHNWTIHSSFELTSHHAKITYVIITGSTAAPSFIQLSSHSTVPRNISLVAVLPRGIIMKCTEILKQEHQVILNELNQIEIALAQLPSTPRNQFERFFAFVREFVDEYHHEKEEEFYFKWMIKRNPQLENGPIACMLKEHDQGRELIKASESALARNDIESLKANIQSFIQLLRDHIDKENNILYSMADGINTQTKDGDKTLLHAFEDYNFAKKEIPTKFNIPVNC